MNVDIGAAAAAAADILYIVDFYLQNVIVDWAIY